MSETSSLCAEKLLVVDVKNDGISDGANEKRLKELAREYILREQKSLSSKECKLLVDRITSLLKMHEIERMNLGNEFRKAKEEVLSETRQKLPTVRELSFSDVRSPAGLSHYIDASGDEAIKILEEQIGIDSTWKIILLTTAYTTIELGK